MPKTLALIKLRFIRSLVPMLVISALGTGIGWLWWERDLFSIQDDERGAYDDGMKAFVDKWYFAPGVPKLSDDIVIIAIDDATFDAVAKTPAWRARYGAWPYDRRIWADVMQYLAEAKAKALVFDATLDEPKADPTGDLAMQEVLEATGLPFYAGFNFISGVEPLPKVTPKNRLPVQLGASPVDAVAQADAGAAAAAGDEEFPDELSPEEQAEAEKKALEASLQLRRELAAAAYAFPVEAVGLEVPRAAPVQMADGTERETHPVPAIEPLLRAASGFGSVFAEPDEDGKMRRTQFVTTDGTNTYVSLSVAVVADVMQAERVQYQPGLLSLGNHRVPINSDGSAEIAYGGLLKKRFRAVSLVDVLRRAAAVQAKDKDFQTFAGKIVLIGGFALGTADSKATPLDQASPGVVKQAAEIDNLLHASFILNAPFWVSLLLAFVVCFVSVTIGLTVRNTYVDIFWPILLYSAFFLLTGGFLVATHVHVLSAMPSFAGTVASILASAYARIFESQERERLKTMFTTYMEPELVEMMAEGKSLPKLDGEHRQITAYFSDIEGFSSVSERYRDDPRALMKLINRYLTAVTPVLKAHGGCIDKFIGDAVVCLFGAPADMPGHPVAACRAALAVQRTCDELNGVLQREGLPLLNTRIGLNTDTMLVGNMGSDDRLDYTAIGDGMNLASRLEGANKAYGTRILVGSHTFEAVKAELELRELDVVRVAGRAQPERVYELLGERGAVPAPKMKAAALYAEALAAYRARAFGGAVQKLQQALNALPDDAPSHALLERCHAFVLTPPPQEWDGVTELTK